MRAPWLLVLLPLLLTPGCTRRRAARLARDLPPVSVQDPWLLVHAGIAPDSRPVATLETSVGAIRCTLWPDVAPLAVANFVGLSEGTRPWVHPERGEQWNNPLYSGTIFHRVIPDFMIQGGDPLGTGRGEPGYTFPDEVEQGLPFDRAGLLATANRGPNTNGSQFFITDGPAPHLDGRWTIFGSCDDTEVVSAIARMPRGQMDRPVEPVVLERVTIQR